ncbi:MAG: hypothetical protein OIN85_00660 [Candidatus Methanoperedens sp.]|nr:hypothetical protein [Candidatus Methanoperedens sp.]
MSQGITRPKADTKKIHSRNEFELCYLRHQYFRKTNHNPTKEEMEPYKFIARHMAGNTFYMYKSLFFLVGLDLDDLISIAQIHLVSFLGLFSLDKLPHKYEEFVAIYHKNNGYDPNEHAVLNKNKANCTLFMKQRMEDVVRVCRQKARNIKGTATEEFFFYYGTKRPPSILRDLLENHEKIGYKKLDTAVYKSIKKKAHAEDGPVFKFNDHYYVAVPVEHKQIRLSDLSSMGMDPYDNMHNMSPEEVYFSMEDEVKWDEKREEFDRKSKRSKSMIFKRFIEANKNDPKLKEEVQTARKLLKSMRA